MVVVNFLYKGLGMDILLQAHGPGFHCYLPFRSYANKLTKELSTLRDLCKYAILKFVTLRVLLQNSGSLCLPLYLVRYLTTLTTEDFEEIECAPFSDAFSVNFFHRALTYRVFCYHDKQEYMVTHGYYNPTDGELSNLHDSWVEVQHKNIMCVCATVHDLTTNNVFYLFDQPKVSLVQISSVLRQRNQVLPEILLWRFLEDLTSGLRCLLSKGLAYGRFGLDNVFLVSDRVVLESGLTRKSCWRLMYSGYQHGSDRMEEVASDKNELDERVLDCLCSLTRQMVPEYTLVSYSESLRDFMMGKQSFADSLQSFSAFVDEGTSKIDGSGCVSFTNLLEHLKCSLDEVQG